MNQLELARLAKEISKIYVKPWHERDKGRLIRPLRKQFSDDDEFYGYVINEWIPKQPDASGLMRIFILVGFQIVPFFECIIQPPPSRKKIAA